MISRTFHSLHFWNTGREPSELRSFGLLTCSYFAYMQYVVTAAEGLFCVFCVLVLHLLEATIVGRLANFVVAMILIIID